MTSGSTQSIMTKSFCRDLAQWHTLRAAFFRALPVEPYPRCYRECTHREDRTQSRGVRDVAHLPSDSGRIGDDSFLPTWNQQEKIARRGYRIKQHCQTPVGRRLACHCTRAATKIDREQLVDHINNEIPAGEVAQRYTEVRSATQPYPGMQNG